MSIFCVKKINPPIRLGQILYETRTKAGLTLFFISQKTRIDKKYLQAIEANNYTALPPARAYRLAYIKEFAQTINYNPTKAIKQFIQENGLTDIKNILPHTGIKKINFFFTSWLTRGILISGVILLFISYLIWQIKGIVTPPHLHIYTPAEGAIIEKNAITIEGETEKEARLTINGQEARVNEQGKFIASLNLSTGVNVITITATKKHGKTVTITRHIVAK